MNAAQSRILRELNRRIIERPELLDMIQEALKHEIFIPPSPPKICDKITKAELQREFWKFAGYDVREEIDDLDWDVKFDWENYEFKPNWRKKEPEFLGPHEVEGRVFIAGWAGGDWEYPVSFIIFLQKGKWRAYIPKEGNVFNKDTMEAFGNGDDWRNKRNADFEYLKKLTPEEFVDCEYEDFDLDAYDVSRLLDIEKMKQDILSNIGVK